MAFQLVHRLFSRGSPPCNRTHGPTVENATGDDQRRETNYGISRDVQKSEGSDWSQLARAMQLDIEGRKSHMAPPTWGPSLSHPMAIHKTVRVRKMKPDKTKCFENEVKSLCWMKFQVPQPHRTGMTTQNLHYQNQPHLSRMLTPMLAAQVLALPINPTPMFSAQMLALPFGPTPVFAAQTLALPLSMQKNELHMSNGNRMELLCKLSRRTFQFRMLS